MIRQDVFFNKWKNATSRKILLENEDSEISTISGPKSSPNDKSVRNFWHQLQRGSTGIALYPPSVSKSSLLLVHFICSVASKEGLVKTKLLLFCTK